MDASPSIHSNDRLRQERIRRNWRQQDLADELETTVVTVKRWERGSQQPSAYFRIKLCALFSKSAEELGLIREDSLQRTDEQIETSISTEASLTPLPAGELGHHNMNRQSEEDTSVLRKFLHSSSSQISPQAPEVALQQKNSLSTRKKYFLQRIGTVAFVVLLLLLSFTLGGTILFMNVHTSQTIPYGSLLYTISTPGDKCDTGGGHWADYNHPSIRCSAIHSIISNASSSSPDLRGTLLTSIPNSTYPDNYVLEAQIQQPTTSSDFGLYFRNQQGDQQGVYTFFIHANSSWGSYVYDNRTGAPSQIGSGALSVDSHTQLDLTAVIIGTDFNFYVNGKHVGEVHDAVYGIGGIGIAVDAGGTILVNRVSLYRIGS